MKNKKDVSDKELEYLPEAEGKIQDFQKKLKKLKDKLRVCQQEKEDYLKGWQRERADFVNYRNQEEERKSELMFNFKKKVFLDFLTVLDHLEMAEREIPKEIKDNNWVKGIIGIKKQLKAILNREGLVEIENYEHFNPEIHEAVEMGEGEDGKILKVIQKGYLIEGKLLRPARVKVGKNNK